MFIFRIIKKNPKNTEKITYFKIRCDPTVVSWIKIRGKNFGVRSMGEGADNFFGKLLFFKLTRGIINDHIHQVSLQSNCWKSIKSLTKNFGVRSMGEGDDNFFGKLLFLNRPEG